jgi:predicted membrane-bound mannosyltransferase
LSQVPSQPSKHRRRRPARAHDLATTGGAVGTLAGPAPVAPSPTLGGGAAHRPAPPPSPTATITATSARIRAAAPRLTVEGGCYLVLIALAILTRFWDLGSRALHHDESLHAYYSWGFFTGTIPYVHDPLTHGPFLFHANALMYLLFGDNDATSRYMPAAFGVALVALPWLLRGPRFLGRWGALAASALFLISPSYLYYSRYIRHDLYTVVGSFLLFAAIVRYQEKPERRWLVLGGATIGFLFTNHEIVFAVLAVFAAFLYAGLLLGRLRPLIPLNISAAFLLGAVFLLGRRLGGPLPEIPWQNPTPQQERAYYRELLTHPMVLGLLAVLIAFLAASWYVANRLAGPEAKADDGTGAPRGWVAALLGGSPPGSIERGVANAWADLAGLRAAFLAGAAIFVLLFTSLFTNLAGLATGTIATDGTLLYWLGQQEVRRGDQPWFYFLQLTPQYEYLALTLGLGAIALTLWRGRSYLRGVAPADPRFTFRLFLVVWFVGIFAGLSYAGEKMPWLIVHFALPLTLLAGGLVGELVERRLAARRLARVAAVPSRLAWVGPALLAALLAISGGWLLLAGRLTYPTYVQRQVTTQEGDTFRYWVREVSQSARDDWWLLALPPLAAVVLIGAAWLLRGARVTSRAVVGALVVALLLVQIHGAWRLSFLEGDTPRDGLIYNTTSPDVTRMMGELTTLSMETTGGRGLEVWFGDDVDWPLWWYLRDFPNKQKIGANPTVGSEVNAPVLIIPNGDTSGWESQLDGYTAQEYVLRWHEPEAEIYRNFAIAPELAPGSSAWQDPSQPHGPLDVVSSIGDSVATLFTPEGQQRLWRLVMYRELPTDTTPDSRGNIATLGTLNFGYTLYVRDDLVPLWDTIRY